MRLLSSLPQHLPARWAGLLLTGALLLPLASTAQTYNNSDVFTGPDDLVYEPGGIINDVQGVWLNQGVVINDGPQENTFINRGVYTSSNGGINRFTSTTPMIEIGGTTQPTFYDVQFLNTSTVNLTNINGALVTNTAVMSSTIVNNVAVAVPGALRFGVTGSYGWTNGPDDAHHVNGYVGKNGPTPFIYPVGSGLDYRYLRASTPNGMAVAFLASNPQGTTSFAGTLSAIFPTATWPIDAAAAGAAITISMPTIPPAFSNADRLRLVGWTGTQWIDLSGAATATGVAEGSELSGTMVAGIQAIGIGTSVVPLAVELRSFAAKAVKADAVLDWQTSSERDAAYFIVERAVKATAEFVAVGAPVAAHGTTNLPHAYRLTDVGVGRAGGTFYYRLRQVDTDGTFSLSDAQAVTFGAPTGWAVSAWPNPTTGPVHVQITTTEPGPAAVEVIDATGRRVGQHTAALTVGTTVVPLTIADALPNGVYVLRVTQGRQQTSIRLVRE